MTQTAIAAPAAEREPILLRRVDGAVATLTLNRPEARNALSMALMAGLIEELAALKADAAVKVVVIAAAGPAFCAGHDLKELRADPRREAYEAVFARCSQLMLALTRLPKPVIARVHGTATAAGCQLVASCDLAVAAREARFATPGVNIGLFCSTPMVALSRAVPRKQAIEMLLTGDAIDADRARELGLVNRVVPAAALDDEVGALARQIAGKSPLTLAIGKEAFYRQLELGLAEAYDYAAAAIDAFLAKRPPVWRGR